MVGKPRGGGRSGDRSGVSRVVHLLLTSNTGTNTKIIGRIEMENMFQTTTGAVNTSKQPGSSVGRNPSRPVNDAAEDAGVNLETVGVYQKEVETTEMKLEEVDKASKPVKSSDMRPTTGAPQKHKGKYIDIGGKLCRAIGEKQCVTVYGRISYDSI